MIKYNFKSSKEAYPEAINTLLRRDVGYVSGAEIASFYYKHFVEKMSIRDMGIKNAGFRNQVRVILRCNGSYAANKRLFDYCLTHYREQLDRLFKVDTVLAPDQEG